jgi:hypothetical protein
LGQYCHAYEFSCNTEIRSGSAALVALPFALVNNAVTVVIDIIAKLFDIRKAFIDLTVAVVVFSVADFFFAVRHAVCVIDFSLLARFILCAFPTILGNTWKIGFHDCLLRITFKVFLTLALKPESCRVVACIKTNLFLPYGI